MEYLATLSHLIFKKFIFKYISYFSIVLTCANAVSISPPTKQILCNTELDNKFLPEDGKCPRSGLLPVKGSCTAYIPCISFGTDLMKPLPRAECLKANGFAFDIELLRCIQVRNVKSCLQRKCYPRETKMEEGRYSAHFEEISQDSEEENISSLTSFETSKVTNSSLSSSASPIIKKREIFQVLLYLLSVGKIGVIFYFIV